jgi:hypothetical protein
LLHSFRKARLDSWRRRALLLVLPLSLALSLWAAEKPLISADHLRQHVEFLASPQMKGRDTGSPELARASKYIADHFKRAGLAPGMDKSYLQTFTVTVGAKMGPKNQARVVIQNPKAPMPQIAYRAGADYAPLNFSDTGEAELALVFAGYGVSADEYRYDDYLHLDVSGKAVIVLRNEPGKDDEKSPFEGKAPTQYSQIVYKAINARNHGAKAVILVNDQPGPGEEDLLLKFGSVTGPENTGILIIQAKRSAVDAWLSWSGKNLADLQKEIDAKYQPQSFYAQDVKLSLHVDLERIHAKTQNVVGILRGSDPKLADEAIVVGAHYDHLGLGHRNSLSPRDAGKVHPGADDNASGTAALLEMAAALGARRQELKRTIVFVAFSGEELGLLGSSYYTKNPAWPLEKTAAMVNLDMVGRPRDSKIYVGGIGTSPKFQALVESANVTGLTLAFQKSGYGASDHSSFYVKNVPVLFFFSGLHSDYHKPTDVPERILYPEQARVADLALRSTMELASNTERPAFVRVQEEQRPVTGSGGGYGAYFGSIPDMGEEVEGVRFADVRDGSPAGKAGLKGGDVLVEFAGKPIKNLYDFTYALRAHKPGETISVTVLRGTERLTVTVTLDQRR